MDEDGPRRPLRFLEIVVFRGGSLEVWRRFFNPSAVMTSIDIDWACARLDGVTAMARVDSQVDPEFPKQVTAAMGGVDAILDDDSHVASPRRARLDTPYPLLSDGVLRRRGTAIEFAKRLVDAMHAHDHRGVTATPVSAKGIGGVHVHDSAIVFEKQAPCLSRHGEFGAG